MSEPEVIVRVEGRVGRLTLNRPQALHALTTGMCREMIAALSAWRDDPNVELVLLDHAGDRGFCAGGDIRTLAESGAGDGVLARAFFFTEYRLDHLLFHYPKPTVAIMDGIVMGGGVGISRPCRFRIGTERTVFAMPETGIGLFPDVGGSWHLSRLAGRTGFWLGLTGARIRAADCLYLGLVNSLVASDELCAVKAELLRNPSRVETLLDIDPLRFGPPPLAARQAEIDRLFAGDSVEAIVAALRDGAGEWAQSQAAALATKSPLSLKVAHRQLSMGARAASFETVMRLEYRIACRLAQGHDFLEGVRAVIVEKDNAPKWRPATLESVTEAMVDAVLAPLPGAEEWSPFQGELA